MNNLLALVLCLLLLKSVQTFTECECEATDESHKSENVLAYKISAIVLILISSGVGICIPIVLKNISSLQPNKLFHLIKKSFAGGIILTTGFVHVLPDAFNSLTNPCLAGKSWKTTSVCWFYRDKFCITTLVMEFFATRYHRRADLRKAQPVNGDEETIVIYSFCSSLSSQAKYKYKTIIIMVLFFALASPIGIIIGMAILKIYEKNSSTAFAVEGVLTSASAGILIYTGLVDLLAGDFMNPVLQEKFKLQFGINFAVVIITCTSLLANGYTGVK